MMSCDWLVLEELIVGRAESRPVNDNGNANVGDAMVHVILIGRYIMMCQLSGSSPIVYKCLQRSV